MKKALLVLMANFLFVCACCSQQAGANRLSKNKKAQAGKVVKDIQTTSTGKPSFMFKPIQRAAKNYNLDSLENGYDSLQIRIWCDYSAATTHLILIKGTAQKYTCQLYSFYIPKGYYFFGAKSFPYTVVNAVPASGWPVMLNSLFALGIKTLPGNSTGADGVIYSVEVATPKNYRFYTYWSPEIMAKNDPGSKNMAAILAMLEKEFAFHRLYQETGSWLIRKFSFLPRLFLVPGY